MVDLLPPERVAALSSAAFTYEPHVGRTGDDRSGGAPPGFHSFTRTRRVERRSFEEAAEDLMTWQVQARAGLSVGAGAARVAQEGVVLLRLGRPPLALRIPCRVVYVLDEPDRVGFAYGTLPGHPELGEERFVLHRDARDRPCFTVSAFSRPASVAARLGGPLGTAFQRVMTGRYLRALDGPRPR